MEEMSSFDVFGVREIENLRDTGIFVLHRLLIDVSFDPDSAAYEDGENYEQNPTQPRAFHHVRRLLGLGSRSHRAFGGFGRRAVTSGLV
jgi:hypothetical protein